MKCRKNVRSDVKHGLLPCLGKFTSDKRNYAARLPVRCSAVFIMRHCGRPYDVVHHGSAKKMLRKRRKVMWFTSIVLWFVYTRCEVHSTFRSLKNLRLNKRNHAVLLPVRCSVVSHPMKCGSLSDELHAPILVSRKNRLSAF